MVELHPPDGSDGTTEQDAHRRTLEIYEYGAVDWQRRRAPHRGDAHEFMASLSASDRPVVDLGCGPGWHLPELPAGTIALDGADAMLRLAARASPGSPLLRADLAALPFARHSVGAVWANKSYVHLDRRLLPMAWRDLHRALRVDAPAHLGLFEGAADHTVLDDDDFPGRSFSLWDEELLVHVLHGAGFDVELLVRPPGAEHRLGVWVRSRRTLADTVGPGMRLLLVGLNPSLRAADAGVGFVTAGNRAWPALLAAGLATIDRDPDDLFVRHRIGMTDMVKRASPGAAEVRADEYRDGLARLEAMCAWLRPSAVCVVGLAGWRAAVDRRAVAGPQPHQLGGRPVYLMPNPSGLNTHVTVEDLAAHFRAAAELADRAGETTVQDADPFVELAETPGTD